MLCLATGVATEGSNTEKPGKMLPLEGSHYLEEFYREQSERPKWQRDPRSLEVVLCNHGKGNNVLEIRADWTPLNKNDDGIDCPKLTVDPWKEKGAKKIRKSGGSSDVKVSASCNCSRCTSRQVYEAWENTLSKRSPSELPPSKKVMLGNYSVKKEGKGCDLSYLPLLRCDCNDGFYEYSAEAYAAKLLRDDRYWFGCHTALALQPDLTPGMRKTLLLWLVEVVRQFNFTLETWCMTVSIFDRFLAFQTIRRDCLQLAGLLAFFIAAKAEEVEPPEIWELVSLCANSYDRNQFLSMEYIMLTHLKFEIRSPTTAFFLHHQVELAKLHDSWPYELSSYLIELLLCDEWLSNIAPSVLATCIFNVIIDHWSPDVYVDPEWIEQVMDLIRFTFLT